MQFNKDYETREKILNPYYVREDYGNIRWFANMPLEVIKKLVELNFADPEETQNNSPSIQEFIDFVDEMENYRDCLITIHGYAIMKNREDYRVSVEELEIRTLDLKALGEFSHFAAENHPDEYNVEGRDYARMWWD